MLLLQHVSCVNLTRRVAAGWGSSHTQDDVPQAPLQHASTPLDVGTPQLNGGNIGNKLVYALVEFQADKLGNTPL
jgi:hypothetical protein